MNSLEFINQEIKFLEDMINMDLALIEDEEDLKEIAKKQERLKHLQQIKAELEAWEVVKEYGAITIDKDVNRITIILYTSPAKEGYDKLEKALEVENEK